MNRKTVAGISIWIIGFALNNMPLSLMGVLLIFLGSLKREKK